MRSFRQDESAGGGLDARYCRRVIAMGVSDKNVGDGFAPHGGKERGYMRLVERSRIDDGDVTAADDIGHRAGDRERSGIVGKHSSHAGDDFLRFSRREIAALIEWDVVARGASQAYAQ